MAQYGSKIYWDNRYEKEGDTSFDWYQKYSGVSHIIKQLVQPLDRVLMLGCGNSKLSEDMVDDGYHKIVNIDIR